MASIAQDLNPVHDDISVYFVSRENEFIGILFGCFFEGWRRGFFLKGVGLASSYVFSVEGLSPIKKQSCCQSG